MLPASSLRQSLTRTFLNATTQLLLEEKKTLVGWKKRLFCVEKRVFVMIKLVCYC